jgi:hypothetical protein
MQSKLGLHLEEGICGIKQYLPNGARIETNLIQINF